MVIKTAAYKTEISDATTKTIIASIRDLQDVIVTGSNSDGSNGANWTIEAWRNVETRRPSAIPADATLIQGSELIPAGGAAPNEKLTNTDDYTHVGIEHTRSGASNADSVTIGVYGRLVKQ